MTLTELGSAIDRYRAIPYSTTARIHPRNPVWRSIEQRRIHFCRYATWQRVETLRFVDAGGRAFAKNAPLFALLRLAIFLQYIYTAYFIFIFSHHAYMIPIRWIIQCASIVTRHWTRRLTDLRLTSSASVLHRNFASSALRKMPSLPLGKHSSLTHSRYAITLSTGKRLVLFRLPSIKPRKAISVDTPKSPLNECSNGWSYYAMEAECPHAGGPLTEAHIDIEDSSYVASCPWHAYDFNVETGESSYGIKACIFPISIRDDVISLQYQGPEDVFISKLDPVSEKVKFKHGPRLTDNDGNPRTNAVPLDQNATLCDWCVLILNTSDPERKTELTTQLFADFATRELSSNPMALGAGTVDAPSKPPRESLNEVKPWEMPNPGRGGTLKSRVTMLHALANIEQWAIDLAIDICVRFATFRTVASEGKIQESLPRTFYYDWLRVANDEAKHFSLLRARLEELGSHFGALPVHHGLWESAMLTADDLRARISIIALVHEARGLDINPLTIEKFRRAGDAESVETLNIIHSDEITHVTTGHRWLSWICEQEGTDPVQVFRSNVQKHFEGAVKGPFNAEARQQAGMDRVYYEDLGGLPSRGHVIAGG